MRIVTSFFLVLVFLWVFSYNLEATTFLFAHGLGGNLDQIHWYKKGNTLQWHIMDGKCVSFNFPEVKADKKMDIKKINLAQHEDIHALQEAHKKHEADEVVLVGISRGAATILNYAATKPKNIKALVLEAPFDKVESIIDYQLARRNLNWIPGVNKLARFIHNRWMHPSYNRKGVKPTHVVTLINKNLPVLFIHSKEDDLISYRCSRDLYYRMKRSGHKHVYLLELNKGKHAQYQHSTDAHWYQTIVHAFYKKYGIPHDAVLAEAGEDWLIKCQP